MLHLRILKLQTCIVGPNGLLAVWRQQFCGTIEMRFTSFISLIHCGARNAATEMLCYTFFFFVKCLYRRCIYPLGWLDVIGHSTVIFLSSAVENIYILLISLWSSIIRTCLLQNPEKTTNLDFSIPMFQTPRNAKCPGFSWLEPKSF